MSVIYEPKRLTPKCACGCGQCVDLAKRTDKRYGLIKGKPLRYIHGHGSKGKPKTKEHRDKLSLAAKGRVGYWKGKKIPLWVRKKMSMGGKGKVFTAEHKEKIRQAMLGRLVTEATRQKLRNHKHSISTRLKMSNAQKGDRGSNWKGGVSPPIKRAQCSLQWKLWREAVFARDKYTCRDCLRTKEQLDDAVLHPHHIKSFNEYPELRYKVSNGITLCSSCHPKRHCKGRLFA